VPVAPSSILGTLSREASDVVCLHAPGDFDAVGSFYRRFDQVDDETVVALLAAGRRERAAAPSAAAA